MKKTQSYRLSEEDKEKLEKVADRLKLPAGQLVATLVQCYIEQYEQGLNLIWPPKFDYYTYTETKIQQRSQETDLENAG